MGEISLLVVSFNRPVSFPMTVMEEGAMSMSELPHTGHVTSFFFFCSSKAFLSLNHPSKVCFFSHLRS